LAGLLLSWGWRRLQTERVKSFLYDLEDQGWFSLGTYKKGQGLKARRGTMLGILLIVGSGLWSSRMQTRSDPAVIIVGILALAVIGWAMDAAAGIFSARLTRWAR